MPKPTPEYLYSEKPTIDQLQMMGWQYIEGDWEVPHITERENFKQVPPLPTVARSCKAHQLGY